MKDEVWSVPLDPGAVLIYAPFHGILTLVNPAMADVVFRCLEDDAEPVPEEAGWIRQLRQPGDRPARHEGPPDPLFLGLIPTRSCSMQCAYCDFAALRSHPLMSFDMIRKAVDGYAELLSGRADAEWNMHFFGGEPFAAFREIVYAVNYARQKAAELGIPTHFEVTTNGYYTEEKARWISENFDTAVLSLDGFPDTQNRHRPGPNGTESFPIVCRTADIFSKGSCDLIIRSCVSAENVEMLPAWAAFLAKRWAVEAVCFEPMIESDLARKNGLTPPDPDLFIRNWCAARHILDDEKIRLVYSSGEISETKNSLCPMGRDTLIVSPEGRIGSCWQLEEYQEAGGIDLHFGEVTESGMRIDREILERQRDMSETNRQNCRSCFCYAHCAGGCVLNKKRNTAFCRMTKAVTLWQLLVRLGYKIPADDMIGSVSYLDWLSENEDFRCGIPDPEKVPDYDMFETPITDHSGLVKDPGSLSLPPLPSDGVRGWIRDGLRIIIGNMAEGSSEVLEGDDGLRFQLEHSGMSQKDIEAVWTALHPQEH